MDIFTMYTLGFVIGFGCGSAIAYLPRPYDILITITLILLGAFVVWRIERAR